MWVTAATPRTRWGREGKEGKAEEEEEAERLTLARCRLFALARIQLLLGHLVCALLLLLLRVVCVCFPVARRAKKSEKCGRF
jgi:hypothetical protein